MESILIFIRIDGAEREVLRGRDGRLGQHVEEGRLADVGEAHDAALEVRAEAPDDDGLLLHLLLLGRHLEADKIPDENKMQRTFGALQQHNPERTDTPEVTLEPSHLAHFQNILVTSNEEKVNEFSSRAGT